MKSSKILSNALILSIAVVIAKIIDFLYIVPLYHIIGNRGGALYGYAYVIYTIFMSFLSLSVVFSISKTTSSYQALGYNNVKKRSFLLAKYIFVGLGVISFIFTFLLSPVFARMIMGDITGGNSLNDITLVIRMVSITFLIIPLLSVYRGYFDGHRVTNITTLSSVIELIVRSFLSIILSLLAVKVFKLPLVWVSCFALIGVFLGPLCSYIYLFVKLRINKNKFNTKIRKVVEPLVTSKTIIKKITFYMTFLVISDLIKALYSFIDIVTVTKALVGYAHFSVSDAETVIGMLTIWTNKFNCILIAIAIEVFNKLSASLSRSISNNDKKDINIRINHSLSLLLIIIVPITFITSFLSVPIWRMFFGMDKYGPSVLSYSVFLGLIMGVSTLIFSILHSYKDQKTVLYSLAIGLLLKCFLNVSLINAFYKMGLPAYFGAITASIIGYLVSTIICFVVLHIKYNVNFEGTIKCIIDILCIIFVIFAVLFLLKLIIPINQVNLALNFIVTIFYLLIYFVLYFLFARRFKLFKSISIQK